MKYLVKLKDAAKGSELTQYGSVNRSASLPNVVILDSDSEISSIMSNTQVESVIRYEDDVSSKENNKTKLGNIPEINASFGNGMVAGCAIVLVTLLLIVVLVAMVLFHHRI